MDKDVISLLIMEPGVDLDLLVMHALQLPRPLQYSTDWNHISRLLSISPGLSVSYNGVGWLVRSRFLGEEIVGAQLPAMICKMILWTRHEEVKHGRF